MDFSPDLGERFADFDVNNIAVRIGLKPETDNFN